MKRNVCMRPASERRPYNVKNCKIAYVTITVLLFRTATLRMGWGGSCFNNICTHRLFQNQRNENKRHKLLRNMSILKIVNIQNGNVVNWITFYIYQFCIVLAFNANKSRDYLRIHVYIVARAFLWPLIFISLLLLQYRSACLTSSTHRQWSGVLYQGTMPTSLKAYSFIINARNDI